MKECCYEDPNPCYVDPKPGNISFCTGGKVCIELDEEKGVVLHRENFPDFTPDDFVKQFITTMEENFNIKFERKGDEKDWKICGGKA